MNNPFVTNGYAGPEYFCDRVEETKYLTSLLTNENNVALISPRRLGKTDLIRHCFAQEEIKSHYYTFIVDIYATQSLTDLVNLLGRSILETLRSKGRSTWERFIQIVASLRSEITFDINGMPSWSVGVGSISDPSTTLDEIFKYLASADRRCLIAIDEFQQITHYSDNSNVEAALRTHIQRCANANFVFSGSQRHLMGEIFMSASRPFYQSVTIFNLKPIPVDKYQAFASSKYKEAGKQLSDDVVPALFERFNNITSYIQKLMNYMFQATPVGEECTADMIDKGIDFILDLSADTYEAMLYQMPAKQRETLLAIARERVATGVAGSKFVRRHRLTSASAVISAVKGLLEKDFITRERDSYWVYDQFFQLYLERNTLK